MFNLFHVSVIWPRPPKYKVYRVSHTGNKCLVVFFTMTVNHGYKSDICWEESIVHRNFLFIYTVHLFLYECITCKVKSCLSNYCTFHMLPQIQNNIHEKKISWWTSCRSCWSGQRFLNSITSDVFHCHAPGKNFLECRTHPLQWSAVMSSHTAFMASTETSDLVLYIYDLHINAPKLDWLNGWFKLYCNYRSFANLADIANNVNFFELKSWLLFWRVEVNWRGQ